MGSGMEAVGLSGQGVALGVVVAGFLAGLRHGFDIDHIAAITDITSSQSNRRRSFWLATTYAAGHALVVVALGSAAVLIGHSIPSGLDSFMRRLIGATLVALGVYVIYSALRFGRDLKVRSRWMLAIAGVRTALRWLQSDEEESVEIEHTHAHLPGHHRHSPPWREGGGLRLKTVTHVHPHRHVVSMPPDPFTEYGTRTSFGIGMLHGVGAETPTQILLFATAAGMAGRVGGTVVLGAFVLGLFAGNTILAIVSTMGSITGRRTPIAHAVMAAATASVSLYVGTLYLLGRDDLLPGPFGG